MNGRRAPARLDVETLLAASRAATVVVIDVPRGHGRSELLRVAFGQGGDAASVLVVGGGRVRSTAALATELSRHLGARSPVAGDRRSNEPLEVARRAVETAAGRHQRVLIAVDDAHRLSAPAVELLGELARSLPSNVHLVIGGAGLTGFGVAELELDGRVQRFDVSDLPPGDVDAAELRAQLFREAATRDVDAATRRLLGVIVALELSRTEACRAVASGYRGAEVDRLRALPGVEVGPSHVVVDDAWAFAAAFAVDADRVRAAQKAGAAALAIGDLGEASRLALAARAPELLRDTVRVALAAQPPRVGAHDLRAWRDSGLLDRDDPHAWWVDAASASAHGAPLDEVFNGYERARVGFANLGDADAEISVGMAGAIVARRRDDLMAIAMFIGRAQELVAQGCDAARAPARFGEALSKQMAGDVVGALAVLDQIPVGALDGDWAAQLAMMRGTILLLLGRVDDAIGQLEGATGWGGPWSHVVSLELLALARWRSGDGLGAVADLDAADEVASQLGAAVTSAQIRALRALMRAAGGPPADAPGSEPPDRGVVADSEALRLGVLARAFERVAAGDLAEARELVSALEVPERAVRSTSWALPLQVALDPSSRDRWVAVVERHRPLAPALAAGDAGAAFLAGGAPAPVGDRSFLPWSWCEHHEPVVEIRLLGAATVRRDGQLVAHPSWERGRVRELCAYLALVPGSARDLIAGRLWPDLAADAANRNLRVTLSYLLDVLDPEREKGAGSPLLVEESGVLRFASSVRLDVRTQLADCSSIIEASARGERPTVLSAARRLNRYSEGPLNGGAPLGEWAEPFETDRRELLLRAVMLGARAAFDAGDPNLAAALARRGLIEDPWAERLHRLVIESFLAVDDLDAARRALRRADSALRELGVTPEPETRALARALGVDLDRTA